MVLSVPIFEHIRIPTKSDKKKRKPETALLTCHIRSEHSSRQGGMLRKTSGQVFLFSNKGIHCDTSSELSQQDGSVLCCCFTVFIQL